MARPSHPCSGSSGATLSLAVTISVPGAPGYGPFGPSVGDRAGCDTRPMKLELTRRGAYAIRAILALAATEDDEVVSSTRIAGSMSIPVRFLPQIMSDLVRAGFVEARVGRAGGYRLRRDPRSITLLDVIEAVEGDTRRRTCVLTGISCVLEETGCDVHEVFAAAQTALVAELGSTTFADVVSGRRSRVAAERILAEADAGAG
jgi:Rrf2 family transcriptional regulator, iron-sulfur cluster assembly transcription factor